MEKKAAYAAFFYSFFPAHIISRRIKRVTINHSCYCRQRALYRKEGV